MESGVMTKELRIEGMTCVSCQKKIERKLHNTAGVKSAAVSYSTGTAVVAYDAHTISPQNIVEAIESLDYRVLKGNGRQASNLGRVLGVLALIVSLYMLLQHFGVLNLLVPSRLADTKMGYGMLFVIGLITSVHCIAMCGGINLSQCIPKGEAPAEKTGRFAALRPAFLYNLGRVISYTVIGFILGFAGMLFGGGSEVGLPAMVQGVLKLVAGVFMVIMGINMLGLFPWLRKLNPRMPRILAGKVGAEKARSKSPLFVGLLNGLMPCGPLQSMQIVALASGNPLAGALSMFLFSLGTVPLMLGLGSIVSALGQKFTRKVMSVGAVLVVVLGLAMLSQGGSLSGFLPPDLLLLVILALCAVGVVSSLPFRKPSHKTASTAAALGVTVLALLFWNQWGNVVGGTTGNSAAESGIEMADGKQIINSTLSPSRYPNITVQAGIPVKWIIDAPKGSINGCNNRIFIQEYGIEYSFKTGENVIEFTPTKVGNVRYSCWMGMIHGTIAVTENGAPGAAGSENASTAGGGIVGTFLQGDGVLTPIPAGYAIPTGEVAIAQEKTDDYGDAFQEVTVELTDTGFRPAVVVVKAGLGVKWNVVNQADAPLDAARVLIPEYAAQLDLLAGNNPLYFYPDVDFDFSTGDNAFYGYMKVVDDVETADIEAIKAEAGAFETLIWPADTFEQGAGGGSCCQ